MTLNIEQSDLSEDQVMAMLQESAERPMTPEQSMESKISYVMGTIGRKNDLTREEVRDIIENMEK